MSQLIDLIRTFPEAAPDLCWCWCWPQPSIAKLIIAADTSISRSFTCDHVIFRHHFILCGFAGHALWTVACAYVRNKCIWSCSIIVVVAYYLVTLSAMQCNVFFGPFFFYATRRANPLACSTSSSLWSRCTAAVVSSVSRRVPTLLRGGK